MTIRPVDFNGMIQNTHEVANTKIQDDNKAILQQQNIQVEVSKEEEAAQKTVQNMEETQNQEYRYGDREGNGSGYEGNKGKKKKKKDHSDGRVVIKGQHQSFDIKV